MTQSDKLMRNISKIIVEQGDTIALLSASIISIILLNLGVLSEKDSSIIILSLLCLLAFHHLRRTMKIEKMHKQINDISNFIDPFNDIGYLREKMGILEIEKMHKQINNISNFIDSFNDTRYLRERMGILEFASTRSQVPIEEMHNELQNAENAFVISRYFKAFANTTVQRTLRRCLENGGTVQILVYGLDGKQLEVAIEPDITRTEAQSQVSQTLRRLENFKNTLPTDQQDRFQYKILEDHIIYAHIIGTSKKIFATTYLNNLTGDECPTFICIPTQYDESLHRKFYDEFQNLWK